MELRAQLAECVTRNMPAPTAIHQPLPSNIDADLDSVMFMGAKSPTTTASTTDRHESKLRLMCASYFEEDGVGLFDLKDCVKEIMALGKISQPEALCNRLSATSKMLANTMDAINRCADWPSFYIVTP